MRFASRLGRIVDGQVQERLLKYNTDIWLRKWQSTYLSTRTFPILRMAVWRRVHTHVALEKAAFGGSRTSVVPSPMVADGLACIIVMDPAFVRVCVFVQGSISYFD